MRRTSAHLGSDGVDSKVSSLCTTCMDLDVKSVWHKGPRRDLFVHGAPKDRTMNPGTTPNKELKTENNCSSAGPVPLARVPMSL